MDTANDDLRSKLEHQNVQVWLEDTHGQRLKLHDPLQVENNEMACTVIMRRGQPYTVRWQRNLTKAAPLSAWCELKIASPAYAETKVAATHMDKDDAETQVRSSEDHLEQEYWGGLISSQPTIPVKPGKLRLEMRRIEGDIKAQYSPHPVDPQRQVSHFDMKVIENPAEGTPPWAVFTFNIEPVKSGRPFKHDLFEIPEKRKPVKSPGGRGRGRRYKLGVARGEHAALSADAAATTEPPDVSGRPQRKKRRGNRWSTSYQRSELLSASVSRNTVPEVQPVVGQVDVGGDAGAAAENMDLDTLRAELLSLTEKEAELRKLVMERISEKKATVAALSAVLDL